METILYSQSESETQALMRMSTDDPSVFDMTLDSHGYRDTDEAFDGQIGFFHIAKQDRFQEEPIHRHAYFEILVIYAGHCIQEIQGQN